MIIDEVIRVMFIKLPLSFKRGWKQLILKWENWNTPNYTKNNI